MSFQSRRLQPQKKSPAKFLVLIVFLVIAFFVFQFFSVGGKILTDETMTIRVLKGTTIQGLLDEFPDSGISDIAYKAWLKANKVSFVLQEGVYEVPAGTKLSVFFSEILPNPQRLDLEITILPGWHKKEISDLLVSRLEGDNLKDLYDIAKNEQKLLEKFSEKYPFLVGVNSLEGFLYPDTYRVFPDASLENIVDKMLANFDRRIYQKDSLTVDDLSFYETLTLASIVEEEEKNSANKPMVAGILLKRFQENWFLGADVTVCYQQLLLGSECRSFVNAFYANSLDAQREYGYEYDTRNNLGLTPTPIASVSADTFGATVDAQKSEYYYYLHDSKGGIHFARDAAEHTRNKNTYLR